MKSVLADQEKNTNIAVENKSLDKKYLDFFRK